jgi:hypothetical protein
MPDNPRRRSRALVLDALELRDLLSAGLMGTVSAEVHTHPAAPWIKTIRGSIHGLITGSGPTRDSDPLNILVTYTGQGGAGHLGLSTLTGQNAISIVPLGKMTNDIYSNGLANLTGHGGTLDITYSGLGHTNSKGQFAAIYTGTVVNTSNLHANRTGVFVAHVSGSERTGLFGLVFTIRL